MKKCVLTLAATALAFFNSHAQSIEVKNFSNGQLIVANNEIINYDYNTPYEHTTTEIDAKNISSVTKYYKLRRYDDVLNTDAAAYFCVGSGNCYTPADFVSPITVTLTAGQSLYDLNKMFLLDLEDGANIGYSKVRYEIFNINDANDVFKFSIEYNSVLSSVKESATVLSSLSSGFPNPSVNKISFLLSGVTGSSVVSVSVINSLGSTVLTKKAELVSGKNTIAISTENFPAGIYFATFNDGKQKATKKFIVTK